MFGYSHVATPPFVAFFVAFSLIPTVFGPRVACAVDPSTVRPPAGPKKDTYHVYEVNESLGERACWVIFLGGLVLEWHHTTL